MNKVQIMGILNLTPDSFYDGGKYNSISNALKHVESLIDDGADIIDIGGESTKPSAKSISLEEEINRVIPTLKEIRKNFPKIKISIDTTKSEMMKIAINEGVDMINDISGLLWDENSVRVIAKSDIPVIIMHSPWRPYEMQEKYYYPNGVLSDIISFFNKRVKELIEKNIKRKNIIIDPGIGFGKSVNDNFEIISKLNYLKIFNLPILLGASNKSYIFNTIGHKDIDKRIEGNVITELLAYKNGVSILRVHNVASTLRTIKLANKFF
jgi:dihydropteroate synthase